MKIRMRYSILLIFLLCYHLAPGYDEKNTNFLFTCTAQTEVAYHSILDLKSGESDERITIILPSKTRSMAAGERMAVKWICSGFKSWVKILLISCDNSRIHIVRNKWPARDQQGIKFVLPRNQPPGKYRVKIEKFDDPGIFDQTGCFSVHLFTRNFQIIFPGLHTNLVGGGTYIIKWYAQNIEDSYVKLGYRRIKNGIPQPIKSIDVRAANKPGINSYQWTVPVNISEGAYRLVISTVDNNIRVVGHMFTIGRAVKPPTG